MKLQFLAVAALCCASMQAQTNVARIGNTDYPTLEAAVSALPTDGSPATIQLLNSTTAPQLTFTKAHRATLDLNGKILQTESIRNEGILTIADTQDGATIKPTITECALVHNYGSLTLRGGSITMADTAIVNQGTLQVDTFSISSGIVGSFRGLCLLNLGEAYINKLHAVSQFYGIDTRGTLTIDSADITAYFIAIMQSGGELTIADGHYVNQQVSSTINTSGKLTINGGQFECQARKMGLIELRSVVAASGSADVTLNGGDFSGYCSDLMGALYFTGNAKAHLGDIVVQNSEEGGYAVCSDGNAQVEVKSGYYLATKPLGQITTTSSLKCSGGFYSDVIPTAFLASGYCIAPNTDALLSVLYPYKVIEGTQRLESVATSWADAAAVKVLTDGRLHVVTPHHTYSLSGTLIK